MARLRVQETLAVFMKAFHNQIDTTHVILQGYSAGAFTGVRVWADMPGVFTSAWLGGAGLYDDWGIYGWVTTPIAQRVKQPGIYFLSCQGDAIVPSNTTADLVRITSQAQEPGVSGIAHELIPNSCDHQSVVMPDVSRRPAFFQWSDRWKRK